MPSIERDSSGHRTYSESDYERESIGYSWMVQQIACFFFKGVAGNNNKLFDKKDAN